MTALNGDAVAAALAELRRTTAMPEDSWRRTVETVRRMRGESPWGDRLALRFLIDVRRTARRGVGNG